MDFFLISQDNERRCIGVVGTQPEHNYWTLKPYLGGLIKEFHDVATDTWIESATQEEILQERETKLLELNLEYTEKISELVSKFVEKKIIDGTPIPQDIIDEREKLKQEYNNLKQQIK